MSRFLAVLSVVVLGLAGAPSGAAAPRYSALHLGAGVTGTDLNASGQVVGSVVVDGGEQRPFLTGVDGRGMTVLDTLGGAVGVATAVNDAGWVVGWSSLDGDPRTSPRHAFVTAAGGRDLRDLGTLGGLDPYGHEVSHATAITSDGRVAGFSYAPGHEARIFVTAPGAGAMTAFSVGGNWTYGAVLNERGQIAGSFNDGTGAYHAFVTGPDGQGVHLLAPATDLLQPMVSAIDAQGRVVGGYWYPDGDWPRPFLTDADGAGMTELGTLGGHYGVAYDLDGRAAVVGQAATAEGALHAFITAAGGTEMQDLNDLVALQGVTLASAVAINARGQVLANTDDGHAYLLTPVPEPAPWALALAGGTLLRMLRSRRPQVRPAA